MGAEPLRLGLLHLPACASSSSACRASCSRPPAIDGGSYFGLFRRIALPLCRPALIIVFVFELQASWSDLLKPLIYLQTEDYFTMPRGLKQIVDAFALSGEYHWEIAMAATLVATLPMIVVFAFAQRYFLDGLATTRQAGLSARCSRARRGPGQPLSTSRCVPSRRGGPAGATPRGCGGRARGHGVATGTNFAGPLVASSSIVTSCPFPAAAGDPHDALARRPGAHGELEQRRTLRPDAPWSCRR